jgi:hypothetical protein
MHTRLLIKLSPWRRALQEPVDVPRSIRASPVAAFVASHGGGKVGLNGRLRPG